MNPVRFPFGPADVQSVAAAANIAITVENGGLTYVKISALTAATTITATVPADMPNGGKLIIELPCGATARDTTFSTGFTGAVVTGVINKTKVASFIYIDGSFIQESVNQIN